MADPIIELDANDFQEEAEEVEQTTAPESSAEETKTEVAEETEAPAEETKEETEGEETATEEQTEEAKAETEETDQPKSHSAEGRKAQLDSEIRDLVSKRNELRAEITAKNAQIYQPQTAEDLINQGIEPAIARVEALEQKTQMAEYNAYVTDLNANLNIESLQVMADFPVFDPNSATYDKTLANRAQAIYQKAAGIQVNKDTGLVERANVLPYDIYKAFAETHAYGARNGQVSGQKAAEKMLAAAETPSSAAPSKEPKEDPFLAGLTRGLKL